MWNLNVMKSLSLGLLAAPLYELELVHADNTDILKELSTSLNHDIDGKGRLAAKYLCEAETNCGGIIFEPYHPSDNKNVTGKEEKELEYTKMLAVPLQYDGDPDVFISSKSWLVQRGAVTIPAYAFTSTVLRNDHDITIEQARQWCQENTECIAFTFPLQSEKSLNTVDEVIYVNRIVEFDYGPENFMQNTSNDTNNNYHKEPNYVPDIEWITHIIHNRPRLMGRIPKHVNLDQSKWSLESRTPYKPCCTTSATLPTIDELKEADSLERIDCSISREEFFEKYEKPRKPVILLGCADDWKATKLWSSFDALQARFKNDSIWEFQSISFDDETDQVIPSDVWTHVWITWGEFQEFYAKMKKDPDYGDIRMFRKLNVGDYVADELRKDYSPPKVFEGADLYEKLPRYKEHWFPKNFGLMVYFIMGKIFD